MRVLYLLSVFVHILAAMVWVGGMAFLVLVVVPWLRSGDRARGATMLRETGRRFRDISWVCFALILATGSLNSWVRGVRPESLVDPIWLRTAFAHTLLLKLTLFGLVLALSAVHDFWLGPRATELLERARHSPEAERARRLASLLGRGNALLGLLLVALGVVLVRGWP